MINRTLLDKKLTEDLIEVADQLSSELASTLTKEEHRADRARIRELLSDWANFKSMAEHLIDSGTRFAKIENTFEPHQVIRQHLQTTLH